MALSFCSSELNELLLVVVVRSGWPFAYVQLWMTGEMELEEVREEQ